MIYVLIAVALNIMIGYFLGNTRGAPVKGVLFSIFLGPIGWALIFALPDERPHCPECRGLVIEGARRCKNCGASLVQDHSPAVAASPRRVARPVARPAPRRPIPRPK